MYEENSSQGVFFICICIEKQEVLCTSLVYMYISAYIVILYHQMSATDVPINSLIGEFGILSETKVLKQFGKSFVLRLSMK